MTTEAMFEWPDDFPMPDNDNYSIDPQVAVIRTQMESGRARQRQRFPGAQNMVKLSWTLNGEQHKRFKSYHLYNLNSGCDWFALPLTTGRYVIPHIGRFVAGKYSENHSGFDKWVVSAVIEIKEADLVTPE